jgi:hypothetical protein
MKLKLIGHWFDTIEEIQTELPRVLDTLTEKDFRKHSKNGGVGGMGVYVREGTTSRVMAANRSYDKFYGFYSVSPEYFGNTLVYNSWYVLCVLVDSLVSWSELVHSDPVLLCGCTEYTFFSFHRHYSPLSALPC